MALTKPQFVHPEQLGKESKDRKSIFDIDAYLETSVETKNASSKKNFDLKTSTPVFHGKEKPEEFKLSIFDLDYYNKDYEDPGIYSLTHFDEPIPGMENAYESETASLISAGHFALSSAGSSRCSFYPTEMSPEFAKHYLPGLKEPSTEPENPFNIAEVRGILRDSLSSLKDEVYEVSRCRNLSKDLSDYILYQLKTMEYSRYRFICTVNIGQNLGQDLRIASRSLWDDQIDTFVTEHYQNKDLFAVATVFAVYRQ